MTLLKEEVADSIALLSHSLDVFRRHSLKGDIKEEYNSLCTNTYPATGALFGPKRSMSHLAISTLPKKEVSFFRTTQAVENKGSGEHVNNPKSV
ncbi:hypothetical protein ElyMa_003139900 [Elysia marginata]|uniref:Uncharacterized protein n=1 Tax=Elysia marginata TaxID=1093978 RepID=A0AAV4ITY4_9GAST|nr:hypothetical protein ElyMa_003139900 [Elysia marginata]